MNTYGLELCYICSPYMGDEETIKRNKAYARELTRTAIDNGFLPVTVHLFITEVMNDNDLDERATGLTVGLGILDNCKYILIGRKYGITQGMSREILRAIDTGKVILTTGGKDDREVRVNLNVAELDRQVRRP